MVRAFADWLPTLVGAAGVPLPRTLPLDGCDDPARRSSHRKELDPNPFDAPWELRLGDLRVLYSVDEETNLVRVLRAGRKPGNTLYIRGVAYDLREKP